jgi:CheY-like chemotaxis protein
VLVDEDEPLIRDLIVEHLAGEGFEPEPVRSIGEARARLAAARSGLIVLDLMLPGQSGLDFLRERATDPLLAEIPVLVASAAAQDSLLEAKRLGADAFLSKPFDLQALSAWRRAS